MATARRWYSRNVLALGLISLLTDTASEMVVPLLPLFLTQVLGVGALALGVVEGFAEATASVLKLLAGRWSDRTGVRRPWVVAGYTLSSLVRPLFAVTGSAAGVVGVRMMDRVGKGLRTSPRDALIAASVSAKHRGKAFGLHRAMDHTGAMLGPLIALLFLHHHPGALRTLFALTAIPGALVIAAVLAGVREAEPTAAAAEADVAPTPPGSLGSLLLPLGLFTLGNASDTFLLLRAGGTRSPEMTLPLLWMALHLVKTLSSVPGGALADRYGRRRIITVGWVAYALIYGGFAVTSSEAGIWALFVGYGLYHGLTEGAEKALVSELSARARMGTGFGWYHLVLGGLGLVASLLFGALWELFGPAAAFLTSAGLALAASVALLALGPSESLRR